MKIRRYTCKDMQEALLKVKMDLGSEAVIMNSKKVKPKGFMGLFAKPMIEVVAAIDDDYVKPSRPAYQQRHQPAYNAYPSQSNGQPQSGFRDRNMPVPEMPQIKEQSPKIGETAGSFNSLDDPKLADLENKVKSMENMLDQIFKAVQGQNETADNKISPNGIPAATAYSPASVSARTQTPTQTPTHTPTPTPIPTPVPPNDAAAIQAPAAATITNAAETDTGHLAALRDILFDHDVEPKLIEKILDKIRERGGQSLSLDEVFSLASRVMTVLLGDPEPMKLKEDKKPNVVLFLGPTGVGKTTTLAKIAADFTLNKQKKVGLITADTYRIAAVEQLKTYAEILNLQVTVVYSPNEIKEAVERLSDNDLILIDTAGRSHRNKAHFDELKMLVSAVNADETYLVVSCNTSRAAIREILEYYAFIRNYKLIFTKLDESPVPGIILNARYMTGKPLSYTTAGQSVPDDLDIANVKQLVASILGRGTM